MTRHKTTSPAKLAIERDPPDLMADLPVFREGPDAFASRELALRDCLIDNLALEGLSPKSVRFEGCVLRRVSLRGSKLPGLKLKDVRCMECDLANVEAAGLTGLRVEFINCRLAGFRAVEAECQHFLISEGDARYSQFRFGVYRAAHFTSSNFQEADFQGSDLRGAVFKSCNLQNAEMTGVKLAEADLRGSTIDGLRANAEDVRGAIVDPAQAMILAAVMGLRIR